MTMKSIRLAIIAVAMSAIVTPAHSAVTFSVQPADGVGLSKIIVGDTFSMDFFITGDPGEILIPGRGIGHYNNELLNMRSFTMLGLPSDLAGRHLWDTATYTAIAAGEAMLGAEIRVWTNTGAYTLAAEHSFNVLATPVPVPSIWIMMTGGFAALGLAMRRRVTRRHVAF